MAILYLPSIESIFSTVLRKVKSLLISMDNFSLLIVSNKSTMFKVYCYAAAVMTYVMQLVLK